MEGRPLPSPVAQGRWTGPRAWVAPPPRPTSALQVDRLSDRRKRPRRRRRARRPLPAWRKGRQWGRDARGPTTSAARRTIATAGRSGAWPVAALASGPRDGARTAASDLREAYVAAPDRSRAPANERGTSGGHRAPTQHPVRGPEGPVHVIPSQSPAGPVPRLPARFSNSFAVRAEAFAADRTHARVERGYG